METPLDDVPEPAAEAEALRSLTRIVGQAPGLTHRLFDGTRIGTPAGTLRFRRDFAERPVVRGRTAAVYAFLREFRSGVPFTPRWPQIVSVNRLTGSAKIELGPEWDARVLQALRDVLAEFEARPVRTSSWLAGSQTVDVNRFRVRGRRIKVISETYMGTVLSGPRTLVEDIAARVQQRSATLGRTAST